MTTNLPQVQKASPSLRQRIVSVFLGADEILADLGAQEDVVAVTRFVDYPSSSNAVGAFPKNIQRIASAEPERILALSPTTVYLSSFNRAEVLTLLEATGIELVVSPEIQNFDDIWGLIEAIGDSSRRSEKASTIIAKSLEKLQVTKDAKPRIRPKALLLSGNYTPGIGTLDTTKMTLAGYGNAVEALDLEGHNPISMELAIALQPEVLILPTFSADDEKRLKKRFTSDPRWQYVPAVQQGNLVFIPSRLLSAISHHAVSAVEFLHEELQRFNEVK